jgi:hypothetical protein
MEQGTKQDLVQHAVNGNIDSRFILRRRTTAPVSSVSNVHKLSVVFAIAALTLVYGHPLVAQEPEILLEREAFDALNAKKKHRSDVIEKLKGAESVRRPPQATTRGIDDYPRGRFENLPRNRIQWVAVNWFQFIPKASRAVSFVRSSGERIIPKNFFTDGGSIPRAFQWSDELSPFGYLPAYLLHDWEFDLHHCKQSTKSFEQVANTMMEALRTLMDDGTVPRNWFNFWMIETGINSFVARELWDTIPPKCPLPPYSPE